MLFEIFYNFSSLKIKAISLAYELPKVVEEEQEETNDVIESPYGIGDVANGEEESHGLNKYIVWVIIVVIVILIGLLVFFVRKIFLSAKEEVGKKILVRTKSG